MTLTSLSQRDVMGEFSRTLEEPIVLGFVPDITYFVPDSDQFTEEHRWIGAMPGFIPWIGTRRVKELTDYFLQIKNYPFETTLSVYSDDIKFDKTMQVQDRINSFGNVNVNHWEKLLSPLIINGETGVAYDGKYFFATDHEVKDSGVMSNLITVDISDMPFSSDYKGTNTIPSPLQIAHTLQLMIQQMMTFKDDEGEPRNQDAKKFRLYVPITYRANALQALNFQYLGHGQVNPTQADDEIEIKLTADPRCTWTNGMALFRTDGPGNAKPFIRQQMGPMEYSHKDVTHDERREEYGAFTRRGIGYALWEHAVKAIWQA